LKTNTLAMKAQLTTSGLVQVAVWLAESVCRV